MDQKKLILILLLLVFGLSLTYRLMNPFEQPRVERLKYQKRPDNVQDGKKQGAELFQVPTHEMMLSLLTAPPFHKVSVIRNPFLIKDEKAKVRPNKETAKLKPPSSPPQPLPRAEDPRERVKRELSKFRIFGFFESGGEVTLFLEKGHNIIIARKGDWIEGRYQVVDIGVDRLKLRVPDIDEYVHIDLSD